MPVTLFLCGDVMLGRGIDQILAHPSDPVLHESFVRDARRYLALAEAVSGDIPRNVADTLPPNWAAISVGPCQSEVWLSITPPTSSASATASRWASQVTLLRP